MARKKAAASTIPNPARSSFDFTPRQVADLVDDDEQEATEAGPGFTLGRGAETWGEALWCVLGVAVTLAIPLVGGLYYVALQYRLVPYP